METKKHLISKYSGAGNDFFIINDLENSIDNKSFITSDICGKTENEKIDGVIFLEKSHHADYKMNYFNRDGTGNSLCGNGLRCTAKYIFDEKISPEKIINIEAVDQIYKSERISDNYFKISLPPPKKIVTGLKLKVNFSEWWNDITCTFIDCGSPHIVIFLDELKFITSLGEINVNEWGRNVRMHKDLMPEGVNVNFVNYNGENNNGEYNIETRVYERGVERETLASGTGSIASAIASALKYNIAPPINVLARSGKILTVDFKLKTGSVYDLSLSGEAEKIV